MVYTETMEMTVQLDGRTVVPRQSGRRDVRAYELCAPPGTLRLGFRLRQPNLFALVWFARSGARGGELERSHLCEPGTEAAREYAVGDPCVLEVSWLLCTQRPKQDEFGVGDALVRLTEPQKPPALPAESGRF